MEYKSNNKYTVELTDECSDWFLSLTESEQTGILAIIGLLEELGPNLGYPHSSKILGSKHRHMRELRVQHHGEPYRVLYAFDPRRVAILLIGGNKTGKKNWYKKFIRDAEKYYEKHLVTLEE